MMKKIFVFVLVVLFAIPTFSQIKLGIKAGVNTTTVPTYNVTTGVNTIESLKDAAYGFHAGAFLRITMLIVYIMPEVVFSSTNYEYNVTTASHPQEVLSQKFNKLEIPVLVGLKLGPLRINAGPAASILINSPKELISDPNFSKLDRTATFGYQAGVGFDLFKTLTFDLRYGGSLSNKFGDYVNIGSHTFNLDHREPSLMLSVGLMF